MTAIEPQTQEPAITLDDLDYFVGPNGLYCFLGYVKDICAKVESLGFGMYYVLAEEKYHTQTGTTSAIAYRMQAFKVVNNIVGRSVTPTTELNFDTIEKEVWFALPKIPYELKEKMDVFFRAVDKEYHTESIVLLTFDNTKADSSGWGLLVPKQTNTSGDCDYEPASIVDEKPDDVYIVGSAHSHPGMSAFASGTDHKDQANFDGLHITYGWRPSVKGGATEFHVEFQMGGNNIIAAAEDVFEDAPKVPVDETELDEWISKVSKKTFNNQITSKGGPNGSQFQGNQWNNTSGSRDVRAIEPYQVKNYPSTGPKINENIMIGVIDPNEKSCPFCGVLLVEFDTDKRRCMSCHQYLAFIGETAMNIVAVRSAAMIYTHDISPDNGVIQKPVYMWHRIFEGNATTNEYELVYAGNTGGNPGK